MIFDISDATFRDIMGDEEFFLPIKWDGVDFHKTIKDLFSDYISKVSNAFINGSSYLIPVDLQKLQRITKGLIAAINNYLNGFPSKAYSVFKKMMDADLRHPLWLYNKSVNHIDSLMEAEDPLHLFRATRVDDYKEYQRARIFHTPYNMRSKVSTCRYSIAGYPSLYLCTSLDLCCKEIHANPDTSLTLAAAFQLDRLIQRSNTHIHVIELGIKPQDFLLSRERENRETQTQREQLINRSILASPMFKAFYLLWYPLIAACSFIRVNKKDPFAAEYIIPQLLMQWIRGEMKSQLRRNSSSQQYSGHASLIGIRYFSCASKLASEEGFNYVFPSSGKSISEKKPYCKELANAFELTVPVFVHDYRSIMACENDLIHRGDFKKIY